MIRMMLMRKALAFIATLLVTASLLVVFTGCSNANDTLVGSGNLITQEMDAIDFLKNWDKSNQVGFIYLDDWHAYNHVKEELILIDEMVGPSSIILIHDLMYWTTPFYHTDLSLEKGQWSKGGPYRAVSELDPNFWEWSTLPWCNGLTILRKKYSSKYHKK